MNINAEFRLPLRTLLELEGWSIHAREVGPFMFEVTAFNYRTLQSHSVTASSEEDALAELLGRCGWIDVRCW